MPNAPAETDARGVGFGTHDVLGATLEKIAKALELPMTEFDPTP